MADRGHGDHLQASDRSRRVARGQRCVAVTSEASKARDSLTRRRSAEEHPAGEPTLSQFEYVSVVVAVIAGLGIVHLLRGIARFIDARGKWKPYWVHLLWTWNVFYSLIAFWWFTWILRDLPVWNLFAFLYILLFAVVRYLQCVVLFPAEDGATDFREIYFRNRKPFFGLEILSVWLGFGDTALKQWLGVAEYGSFLIVQAGGAVVATILLSIAMRSASPRFHAGYAVFAVVIILLGSSGGWRLAP